MNGQYLQSVITQMLIVLLAIMVLAMPGYAAADEEEAEVDIGYYALEPSFVSNLTGGPKYIRCDIQLMTKTASEIPQIELHEPAIRHHILMLLAGKNGKTLKTPNGKENLRKAALGKVRSQLETLTGSPIVDDLYFTAFYVK